MEVQIYISFRKIEAPSMGAAADKAFQKLFDDPFLREMLTHLTSADTRDDAYKWFFTNKKVYKELNGTYTVVIP